MNDSAIIVEGVSKSFRIFSEQNKSIKAALLRGSRARYQEFWALDDVSLEIPVGKTFGLLGNNGSGKSTLLKCIARILEPNKGRIQRRGRMAAMLEVGSGFHPELTGRENIYLNSAILGMTRAETERKLDSIVDFAGDAVARSIDQPVKNYSSGMYVRLGFSVSIHVEPEILLVDEVLAVGDMEFQEKCMEKFADLKRDGRTVVVVSHALDQMRTFCDEAAWLDHGQIANIGNANDVISSYVNDEHGARSVDGMGTRYGTGEVLIDSIEVIAADEVNPHHVASYEPVTLRMSYTAKKRIPDPSFIFSVDHVDGHLMWANHTKDVDYLPASIEVGKGSIDVVIPSLSFRAGSFYVNGSVHSSDGDVLDCLSRSVKLKVIAGEPSEAAGLVALNSHFDRLVPDRPLKKPKGHGLGAVDPEPWSRKKK